MTQPLRLLQWIFFSLKKFLSSKAWNLFWCKLPFVFTMRFVMKIQGVLFRVTLGYLLGHRGEIPPEPSPLQGDATFSQKRSPVIPQRSGLWLCHPRARTLPNFTQLLLPAVPACPGPSWHIHLATSLESSASMVTAQSIWPSRSLMDLPSALENENITGCL